MNRSTKPGSTGQTLHLLIPNLIGKPPSTGMDLPQAQTPALSRMLSRASRFETEKGHDIPNVLASLLVGTLADKVVGASAALRYLEDTGASPEGYCLAIDPVHLMVGREQIIMGSEVSLAISAEEAAQFKCILGEVFPKNGSTRLETPLPDHWYLFLDKDPETLFAQTRELSGQGIRRHMPSGPLARYWKKMISDTQVLLHDCPTNRQRQGQGKLAINSLWPWGGGTLPEIENPQGHWRLAIRNDPVIKGLGRLVGCRMMNLDTDKPIPDALLDGQAIACIEAFAKPEEMQEHDYSILESLDRLWFQPVASALRTGSLEKLVLWPMNGSRYELTTGMIRRWWKRTRPLEYFS